MDVIQRLIGWWNPTPPPPTAIIVSTAPALPPTKCLPTTVMSAVPASINPVNAGLDLCAILATIRNDWAHAWPEAITTKSNANRLYNDLFMLFLWRIPHQIKESLWWEIWTTIIYLKSPVAAIMARGFLIADLPFIVTPLCFLSACFYGIYRLNNIKRPIDFSDEAKAEKALQRNLQLDQKITDLETKVQELKTSGEELGKENADLKTRLEKSSQINKGLAAINDDTLAKNEKLDAENNEKADQIAKLGVLLDRYEEHTGKICKQNEKIQDKNSDLTEEVKELRLKNARLEVEKIIWQSSLADSESGDEASPQSRTGAEAGPSTDKAKSNVNGDSKKPEANDGKAAPPTDQPQSAKAADDSNPPPIDKQSSAGRIEGDASDKEEGQAGPSTPQTPATNAGEDSEAFPDGESTAEPNENDTADGQAEKKRRRKKRGGMKVRAAKEAAWARANGIGATGDEAKKADGGEATEADEGDAE
ncbi:MAG: hypothetical protein Q9195_008422 [Heterodermia aff. obscurata]